MKCRTILALVLALIVLLALIPGAAATEDVFFVAVNDTIPLTLTGVAPYYSSGGLYVPYTVFDAAPGGVSSAYNAEEQTFVLFTRGARLVFDLAAETVQDENGKTSSVSVSYRGGILYVPLSLCASHFGLSTSMLTSAGGYTVLRFSNGNQVYEDSLFIEKAENLIAYRIAQLEQPDSSAPPVSTDRPNPPAGPTTQEPPAAEPAECCLAITDASGMQAAADTLNAQQLRAAFFLTEREIEENRALVRALYLSGHMLGVRAEPDAADVGAALDAANEALYRVLQRKAVLALAAEADETLSGYCVFSPDMPAETVSPVPGQTQFVVLGADASAQISQLLQQGATLTLLRETTRFD